MQQYSRILTGFLLCYNIILTKRYMIQKIIKVGNSYAVTIPKGFLDSLEDRQVRVKQDYDNKRLIIDFTSQTDELKDAVDPEVLRVGKQLLTRYHAAFEELAKK